MGRFYLTKPAIMNVASSLLALSIISMPVLASTPAANLRQGLPGRRISGGSRSPGTTCLTTPNQPVIALMPENNVGTTLSERPTFWFSLPAVNQDRALEFGLFNQDGDLVYQKSIAASGEAGIIPLSLPETAAPLTVEQNYRWYLSVVCNPESRAEDLMVTGWVRRVTANSNLMQQIEISTPEEQLALYQASDLWYDTLNILSEMRRDPTSAPQAMSQWSVLMQAVELPQVLMVPFGQALVFDPA